MLYLHTAVKYMRDLKNQAVLFLLLLVARPAFAIKLSGFTSNWKSELAAILPVILLGIAALGVAIAGTAIISGIYAKKNTRPLEWQVWGVVGGALAIMVPMIILAFAGSLTSENGGAEGVMSDLNLKY